MSKMSSISEEIRRITNETAAEATRKALEVTEAAKSRAAEVSTLAITEALKVATLAAAKAAEAASAAAAIAASTSKDIEYIKQEIATTKLDIKSINEKLDNKYVSKEEFKPTKDFVESLENKFVLRSEFVTIRLIVFGACGLILAGVFSSLIYLVIRR